MAADHRRSWSERVRWDLLMLYLGVSGLSAILGALTIVVFTEHTDATGAIRQLEYAFIGLTALFATYPFINPALEIATERLLKRWSDGEETTE
jgi:hypothetical protein